MRWHADSYNKASAVGGGIPGQNGNNRDRRGYTQNSVIDSCGKEEVRYRDEKDMGNRISDIHDFVCESD